MRRHKSFRCRIASRSGNVFGRTCCTGNRAFQRASATALTGVCGWLADRVHHRGYVLDDGYWVRIDDYLRACHRWPCPYWTGPRCGVSGQASRSPGRSRAPA